jgi:CRISPR-associated protein Csm4
VPVYAVYLLPRASFVSSIGSDTLFGALCWAVRALSGANELEATLKRFAEASATGALPPFAISSAFPFLHHDGLRVRLYPKPLIPELRSEQVKSLAERERQRYSALRLFQQATAAVSEKAKRVKDATYVSEELFTQLVRRQTDACHLCERLVERGSDDADILRWGSALITHRERSRVQAQELHAFAAEGDVQRNEIERIALATAEGRLFFTHEMFLHREQAGLWFVLRTDDRNLITPLLRYLADTGIGGERSVGKGHFDIPLEEIHELDLPRADQPNCFVTLSRYIPTDGECDFRQEPLAYTITAIRPKHEASVDGSGHHTYKRLLRVFEPGSLFPFRERKEIYGRIVNVGRTAATGGFEAYHSGLAVPVFARIGGTP